MHKNKLRKGIHENKHLQNVWNKYGEENFEFEVVEEILEKSNLINREQYYIDNLKPEYNICKIAGSTLGVFPSQETRVKLSIANLGNKKCVGKIPWNKNKNHSKETLDKLSISQLKRFEKSRNPKAKLSEEQVKEIRDLYAKGDKSYRELGKLFNLYFSSIGDIIKNKTYKLLKER